MSGWHAQGEMPHHWYGVSSGLLKWSVTATDGRSITFGGMSTGSRFNADGQVMRAPAGLFHPWLYPHVDMTST